MLGSSFQVQWTRRPCGQRQNFKILHRHIREEQGCRCNVEHSPGMRLCLDAFLVFVLQVVPQFLLQVPTPETLDQFVLQVPTLIISLS